MALHGNLKEFELADIFQLIGQQKKSGRLLLQDKKKEAWCYFRDGNVVNAGSDTRSLFDVIPAYLRTGKKISPRKISDFYTYCKGSISIFADVLVNIQYISEEDLLHLAEISIEDLACELFAWKDGSYSFEPLEQVDDQIVRELSFPVDAIAMEAMRRLDEEARMRETITPGDIFIPAGPVMSVPANEILSRPDAYLLTRLDGRTSVQSLTEHSFLSRYRIYETLLQLLSEEKIRSLPREVAALSSSRSRDRDGKTDPAGIARLTTVSVLITAFITVTIILAGVWGIPHVRPLPTPEPHALSTQLAYRKYSIAHLRFHAETGTPESTPSLLVTKGYLQKADLVNLYSQ